MTVKKGGSVSIEEQVEPPADETPSIAARLQASAEVQAEVDEELAEALTALAALAEKVEELEQRLGQVEDATPNRAHTRVTQTAPVVFGPANKRVTSTVLKAAAEKREAALSGRQEPSPVDQVVVSE